MNSIDIFERLVRGGHMTRREAMAHIAKIAGLAGVVPVLNACGNDNSHHRIDAAAEVELKPEDLPIDTIVTVMMENRSFDHYFGSYRLLEGRMDIDGLTGAEMNLTPDATPVGPFDLGEFCISDPPHSWGAGRAQFDGGANDGFVREHFNRTGTFEKARQVMGYHERNQLPFYYGLADEFVLCQNWFCSVLGPTWPNRFYVHAGTSGGTRSNDFPTEAFPSIYDRLNEAGISWKYYYSDLPFLALFVDRIAAYAPNMRPIQEFYDDAAAGTLPNYCFVDPSFALADDHPPHHVQLGQSFVSSVFHALAGSPQWDRSAFFLTYDEWGGFYDHVPPPTTDDDRVSEGFDQLGFRVPSIVAGPYAKRGAVTSGIHDHASILAFLEWFWDLEPLTKRDAAADHLVETFDTARVLAKTPREAPTLPEVIVDESQFRPFCIFEALGDATDLEIAADKGRIPRVLDRRPYLWDTMATVLTELQRHGKGGLHLNDQAMAMPLRGAMFARRGRL
ncbi:MAG: alkaline phosphatase family protein [Myxococcales bacterium]|nr:alkaline phosphatase family protein [Myxococcales bacterium]